MDAHELGGWERDCQITLDHHVQVDASTRAASQARVLSLGTSLAHMKTLQSLLDQSSNNFAVVAAANTLLKLVTDYWNSFSEAQRMEIRE